MDISSEAQECIDCLNEILRIWLAAGKDELNKKNLTEYKGFIAHGFNGSSMSFDSIRSVGELKLIERKDNIILISFINAFKILSRARFIFEDAKWRLLGTDCQCTICFGTGINEFWPDKDKTCTICDGSGWSNM